MSATATKVRYAVLSADATPDRPLYVYRAGRSNPDWRSKPGRAYASTQYVWTENIDHAVTWATPEAAQRHADRTGGTITEVTR